jgi:hypothetical protein
MTTAVKVGLGLVGVTVIYLGFIRKDENGYTAFNRLMDPTKGGRNVEPRTAGNSEMINAVGKKYSKGADLESGMVSRMKVGTKDVIGGEVCEWNGSNWVNCKPLPKKTVVAI